MNLTENVLPGVVVTTVSATDADTGLNGKIWYQITAGNKNKAFRINNSSGDVITVGEIDREKIASYMLTIKAEDYGFPASRKVITLSLWLSCISKGNYIVVVAFMHLER